MSEVKIGIIGGTGIGDLFTAGTRHEVQTPFGAPSDAIVESAWEGMTVLTLKRHGAGHVLPPSSVPFRANIFAMKMLGCTHILASGACGSLRQEFKPGELVVPDQVIDRTYRRAGTFYENAAVHVEFAEPFCPVMRRILLEQAAAAEPVKAHERGCYLCMEGPAFSTRAESLTHRLWGGDLVGMTAMPEAKLAREAEIPYAMIGLVTDYDSWKSVTAPPGQTPPPPPAPGALLEEIRANLQSASEKGMELVRRFVRRIAGEPALLDSCPAKDSLKLAIWSDKSKISAAEIQRLSPLWGKYFG